MTDALIVGAGPAGSALAYFLARQGVEVLLLDKADFPRDKTCGDGLTPRAVAALREMGVLETAAHTIHHSLLVAPNGRAVSVPTSPGDGLPALALVLPRWQLDERLLRHAVAAGARFIPHATVRDVIRADGRIVGVQADTTHGSQSFQARFTFIATGAAMSLLQRGGLLEHRPIFARAARIYYENVSGLSDAFEFFWERTLLPGYGWIFPTSATAANIGVITYDEGLPPRTLLEVFVQSPHIRPRLQNARPIGQPKGYPLRIDFPATRTTFPGAALVGEAAGLVNPVTGEGIDYALESAQIAAEIFGPALRAAAETGEHILHQYAQALRLSFTRTFHLHAHIREFVLRHAWLLNHGLAFAQRRESVRGWLTQLAHGERSPSSRELWRAAWQLVTE